MYSFLPEDWKRFEEQIENLKARIREIGQDMGASCREGAETFHDNFAYEQGERDQRMWAQRFRELKHIHERSRIVQIDHQHPDKVTIGKVVTVRNEDGVTETFRIGSYLTFDDSNTIPYNSPLAKLLIGGMLHKQKIGVVGGILRTYTIIKIVTPK
ncbi:MAG: hypothetical protein US18_C0008G0009 [Parcubacteria group bacterium GW2011_GWB1_36_5]|nr:MAG: hypothetical protein US18_C0008G0009 [Parcubacteria group bacterium GW2011_GWB1_36_5]